MRLVVDASVVVKWIFPDNDKEADVEQAMVLFESIRKGQTNPLQPPHWLAEVAAVSARLDLRIARAAVGLLHAMQFSVADSADVYSRACELAGRLDHHLFDTLYHAVALTNPGSVLVTADQRYFRKAQRYGSIMTLAEFSIGE